MKQLISPIVFTLLILVLNLDTYAQQGQRCSMDRVIARMRAMDPNWDARMQEIQREALEWSQNHMGQRMIITIPVHAIIVHLPSEPIGTGRNVAMSRIQSQIDVLNADFRRMNADTSNTPSMFQGVAADCEIEFCLASVDPNGNPTDGVTRYAYSGSTVDESTMENTIQPATIWDRTQYMNMWVARLAGGDLGYASFPDGTNPNVDGIVVLDEAFGVNSNPQYGLGRTATHEVGHYLNLFHIWGDGPCGVDDGLADTPESAADYGGCPTHPQSSCGSVDMFMNYMDYVDDACMNLFTQDQKSMMVGILNTQRSYLLNAASTSCAAADTAILVISEIMYNPPESGTDSLEYIEIYNSGTSVADLTGYMLGGVNYTFGSVTLNAGEYLVVAKDAAAINNVFGYANALEWTSGGLTNGGETILLLNAAGDTVDIVTYNDASPWPSAANGQGSSLALCNKTEDNNDGNNWQASNDSTSSIINGILTLGSPGADDEVCSNPSNPGGGGGTLPTSGEPGLVISEIMYNDPSTADNLEFLEFYNSGDSSLNLNGSSIIGVTFTFPDTIIESHEYLVVAKNAMSFDSVFGWQPFQFSGGLNNSGEMVGLLSSIGDTLFSFNYDDNVTNGWPSDADGGGASLVICDPLGILGSSGNWAASEEFVGMYTDSLYASPESDECTSGCRGDNFEPNNGPLMAADMPLAGVNRNAVICDPNDEDWFIFTVGDDPNFRLTLGSLSADLDLELYSASAPSTALGTSDLIGYSPEVLVMNGAASGSVFLARVYSGDGSTSNGGYTLRVQFRDAAFAMPVKVPGKDGIISTPIVGESTAVATKASLGIYPNPTDGLVNVAFEATGSYPVTVRTLDIFGKEIQRIQLISKKGHNSIELNTVNWSSGVYFIDVWNGGERMTGKLQVR